MTAKDVLPILLESYSAYYNVKTEEVTAPFAAEAEFISNEEQYFLSKKWKLSEAQSREYVFFAATEQLTLEQLKLLDETAWETGMSRVVPHASHRNSDVILIVVADKIDADVAAYVKKLRRYKEYNRMLHGWSHYRVICVESSSGNLIFNRMGRILKKLFRNIKF